DPLLLRGSDARLPAWCGGTADRVHSCILRAVRFGCRHARRARDTVRALHLEAQAPDVLDRGIGSESPPDPLWTLALAFHNPGPRAAVGEGVIRKGKGGRRIKIDVCCPCVHIKY